MGSSPRPCPAQRQRLHDGVGQHLLGGAAAVARGVRLPQSQQLCPRAEAEQEAGRSRSSPLRSSPSSRPAPTDRAGTLPAPPSPARSARPAARSSSAAPGRPASGPAALSGRGAVPDGRRRTPPRGRACRGGRASSSHTMQPLPVPAGRTSAAQFFCCKSSLPLHGRLFYLNHATKIDISYPFCPFRVVQKFAFSAKKKRACAKLDFPACAAPAFFLQKCYFHALFLS